jgi:hypothetical protein
VADNVVLIMRFHPVGGEDVSVVSEDFAGESEALEAIARALDERRSLVLVHARYDREAGQSGVIINLASVVDGPFPRAVVHHVAIIPRRRSGRSATTTSTTASCAAPQACPASRPRPAPRYEALRPLVGADPASRGHLTS